MQAPNFWQKKNSFMSLLLMPLSWLYGAATALRLRTGPRNRIDIPVICVGNINMGGTGKTPTVIDLVMRLSEMGKTPVVVSRGYGGSLAGPVIVTPDHTADDVGDEPVLLSGFGTVCVSRDRFAGAKLAVQNGADVLILDDGLQNPALTYDLTITVVDRTVGFGNERVFPAGPLRETVSQGLSRSDLVLAIGHQGHVPTESVPLLTGVLKPLETGMDWKDLNTYAFAGIGRPEKFFNTLRSLGAKVIETREFGDHQKIPETMLKRLDADAWAKGAQLVTTEKDAARLPKAWQQKVLTLPVRLSIDDDSLLVDRLTSLF